MTLLDLTLLGGGAMVALMGALWWVQRARRNAGIVDVAWSLGTGVLGVWFALAANGGETARQWLLATMIGLWGARLGWHLARRVAAESEDGRYARMREALGARVQPVMFAFFQIQALWAVLFALPVWAAAGAGRPLDWLDAAGIALFAVSAIGEHVADRQLATFRASASNRGKVCDTGLWRYSRHPNYFFEWLHWWAYVMIGAGAPHAWVTLAGVLLMYVFLTRITGIPHTERQALSSRGDAYRSYQARTSPFFPLPPSQSTR